MFKSPLFLLGGLLIPLTLAAGPPGKPDIVVMTQNQYLGADLNPIINAETEEAYALAVLEALATIADNDITQRVHALAESIAMRDAHLVGLQEMFRFDCVDGGTIPNACDWVAGAMNDHLQLTLDALESLGADYRVAGVVDNLTIPGPGFGLPGLPVFLNGDAVPDVFIQVLDRDVILARGDVPTQAVDFGCANPSADGCNFEFIAEAETQLGTIEVQRGFVGVDALVGGDPYRFVNTHLEVQYPADDPAAPVFQAVQAAELFGALLTAPNAFQARTIVVGDFNSDPRAPAFLSPLGLTYTPWMQFAHGLSLTGDAYPLAFADSWLLRPGKPAGYTCCQAPDLSNAQSMLNERIDLVFSWPEPVRVKANVLGDEADDATAAGLWPSDHASVVARLFY
jgi:endonuclease/exonuclease/phosphatase family metal-dependent hydrolase